MATATVPIQGRAAARNVDVTKRPNVIVRGATYVATQTRRAGHWLFSKGRGFLGFLKRGAGRVYNGVLDAGFVVGRAAVRTGYKGAAYAKRGWFASGRGARTVGRGAVATGSFAGRVVLKGVGYVGMGISGALNAVIYGISAVLAAVNWTLAFAIAILILALWAIGKLVSDYPMRGSAHLAKTRVAPSTKTTYRETLDESRDAQRKIAKDAQAAADKATADRVAANQEQLRVGVLSTDASEDLLYTNPEKRARARAEGMEIWNLELGSWSAIDPITELGYIEYSEAAQKAWEESKPKTEAEIALLQRDADDVASTLRDIIRQLNQISGHDITTYKQMPVDGVTHTGINRFTVTTEGVHALKLDGVLGRHKVPSVIAALEILLAASDEKSTKRVKAYFQGRLEALKVYDYKHGTSYNKAEEWERVSTQYEASTDEYPIKPLRHGFSDMADEILAVFNPPVTAGV